MVIPFFSVSQTVGFTILQGSLPVAIEFLYLNHSDFDFMCVVKAKNGLIIRDSLGNR